MPVIRKPDLTRFATALLAAGGYTAADAEATADLLVWANLRGADSHGVLRIPRYIEMAARGTIRSGHPVEVVHRFGATAIVDGGRAPGAVGMNVAARTAGELARQHGIGWCAARDISHAGAVGYFAAGLAAAGQVGLAMTASRPLMSYPGARGEAVSTNPLAIAAPSPDGRDPILLDMATSAGGIGKIMAARDAGAPIPKGWAVDADGAETEDPNAVAVLLPMAGPKGAGLSLMIEVLTSVLAMSPVIAPALGGDQGVGYNGLVIAIDPAAFGEPDRFRAATGALADAIHGLEPAAGPERVRLPGERGFDLAREREAKGIPLAAGTAKRLVETAQSLGVTVPAALAQEAG